MTAKAQKALGRSDREGISVIELFDMFPDEDAAVSGSRRSVGPTVWILAHAAEPSAK